MAARVGRWRRTAVVGPDAANRDAIRAYASFHAACRASEYLSDDFVDADFDFFGRELNGQMRLKPRWKRVVSHANGLVGELVGRAYVAKHFPSGAKTAVVELVRAVAAAVEERLREVPWMTEATKTKALEKMEGFRVKIGFPDEWVDYASLELRPDAPYYANVAAAKRFEFRRALRRMNAPVDRERWFMAPQQVNAYYHPTLDEIVFPAAILQPPFFHPDADDAVNFGAIGAVIGHEMTHGFDDQGRKFDASGNMNDWWAPEDSADFVSRAAVMIKQADDVTVCTNPGCVSRVSGPFSLVAPGIRSVTSARCLCRSVNGELTQGENIADLGGLRLAYRAWAKRAEARTRPPTNGAETAPNAKPDAAPANFPADPKQRFFFSWATVWRQSITAQLAAKHIATDPHAPPEVRVNVTVSNMPEFVAAFDLTEGDALWRPESERVDIW